MNTSCSTLMIWRTLSLIWASDRSFVSSHSPFPLIMYTVLSNQSPKGKAYFQIQFEIVSMTFSNLTAEQSCAGQLCTVSCPALSSPLPYGRFLIKQDWVISLAKVINVSNSPSSYLLTLAWCYPDPEHISCLPANRFYHSKWYWLPIMRLSWPWIFMMRQQERFSCRVDIKENQPRPGVMLAIRRKIIYILAHDINLYKFLVCLLKPWEQ